MELIFQKRDDGCNGNGALWDIVKRATNNIEFAINVANAATTYVLTVNNALDNNWHHLAFIRNGTIMVAYKDGILVANTTSATIVNVSNTANLGISTGACSPFIAGGGFFTGSLDEVRLCEYFVEPKPK